MVNMVLDKCYLRLWILLCCVVVLIEADEEVTTANTVSEEESSSTTSARETRQTLFEPNSLTFTGRSVLPTEASIEPRIDFSSDDSEIGKPNVRFVGDDLAQYLPQYPSGNAQSGYYQATGPTYLTATQSRDAPFFGPDFGLGLEKGMPLESEVYYLTPFYRQLRYLTIRSPSDALALVLRSIGPPEYTPDLIAFKYYLINLVRLNLIRVREILLYIQRFSYLEDEDLAILTLILLRNTLPPECSLRRSITQLALQGLMNKYMNRAASCYGYRSSTERQCEQRIFELESKIRHLEQRCQHCASTGIVAIPQQTPHAPIWTLLDNGLSQNSNSIVSTFDSTFQTHGNMYRPGGNMYRPGGNMYGPGGNMYVSVDNMYGTGSNKFGSNGNIYGTVSSMYATGGSMHGPVGGMLESYPPGYKPNNIFFLPGYSSNHKLQIVRQLQEISLVVLNSLPLPITPELEVLYNKTRAILLDQNLSQHILMPLLKLKDLNNTNALWLALSKSIKDSVELDSVTKEALLTYLNFALGIYVPTTTTPEPKYDFAALLDFLPEPTDDVERHYLEVLTHALATDGVYAVLNTRIDVHLYTDLKKLLIEVLKVLVEANVSLEITEAARYYLEYEEKLAALTLIGTKKIEKKFDLTGIFTDTLELETLPSRAKLAFKSFFKYIANIHGNEMENFSSWSEAHTRAQFMKFLFDYFLVQDFVPADVKNSITILYPFIKKDGRGSIPP